ncbi:MAG: TonB-dependent receptor [Acidobacteriales bacterium]|nr:TonB-dependent receptor [Terriglobales bacterium]
MNIPKIYKGGSKTFFFVNYNGARSQSPFDQFSTVPTLLERTGNFSQTTYASGPNSGQPVQIFDPFTGLPYPNNTLPAVNPVAAALLKYIPAPNVPGTNVQNFHYVSSADSNSDDLNIRLNRALGGTTNLPRTPGGSGGGGRRSGPQNNLSFGFHYHAAGTGIVNPFPTENGNTSTRSFDIPVAYIRSFGKLTNIARIDYNRNRTRTTNLYAFSQDVAGLAGITGISQDPFDYGLPSLGFTNFTSVQDVTPQLLRNQTITFSDNMIWPHGKNTWRWGGDFRRIQTNIKTDSNGRGSFVFSGLNTSNSIVDGTGYDFADFLLGLPQQTSAQYGLPQYGYGNFHFRGNSWDLYAQDEWRIRGNLTFNLGLRYEYVSPFAELDDRVVNLDLAPSVLTTPVPLPASAVVPVQPGQTGPYHGFYANTLVHPDRNNFAPRIGIAWKPFSKTVVRAGYGISYNTSAYQNMAQQLAFQPPFAIAQTNVQQAAGNLTLQNGFPAPAAGVITNSFAVDPNYRLGYVQIRNLDIQQQIRPTLLLNLDYTGTKGTRLDILEDPNRDLSGIRIANVQPFYFENSLGASEANAGSIRLRKRLQNGISVGGTYTYSKSIDDASTIGAGAVAPITQGGGFGGGTTTNTLTASAGRTQIAQDPFNLAAERGLSSFDQRHKFVADYLWELPFGSDRRWLTSKSIARDILGDWQWNGDWTIASGLPFTPIVLGNPFDLSRGTNGTLRPDVVPGEPIIVPNPNRLQWFNTAAFVAPPPGNYGDARRNSIIGPGTTLFNMGLTKLIPLKHNQNLELRIAAANVFNTPQFTAIDTSLGSASFGRIIAVGAMRILQFTARFRF